ncbi:YqjD family protein [Comamonas sp. NLF-1-9]|uniref:DUF883 family protein n=1 Tax=Comamonas sp. NLF-1-9 TaxID=2853163 RepID=UPI001C4686CA|nr:hypothetical protein [Comamonas sp. NLF-1-9]QXL85292.1 hypothetical protein KUD94_04790 [Comamonas sp. NLF-1-9]
MNMQDPNTSASRSPFPVSSQGPANPNDSDSSGAPPAGKPEVVQQLERGAREAVEELAEDASTHVRRIQQTLSNAGESLQQTAQTLKETGDEWLQCLRGAVQERPLTSVSASVALGWLLGRLCRR